MSPRTEPPDVESPSGVTVPPEVGGFVAVPELPLLPLSPEPLLPEEPLLPVDDEPLEPLPVDDEPLDPDEPLPEDEPPDGVDEEVLSSSFLAELLDEDFLLVVPVGVDAAGASSRGEVCVTCDDGGSSGSSVALTTT